jgi:hypothetical protein
MENLAPIGIDHSPIGDRTLGEYLVIPYWPITLQRPMRLFKGALGLHPGIAATPEPEFLVRLLTGHLSHQALVREAAGPYYKNLENLVRARHQPNSTTRNLLACRLNLHEDDLLGLSSGPGNGPLLPTLLAFFRMLEGAPLRFFGGVMTSSEVPCPHCGANLLDDVDAWWRDQPLKMEKAEYEFAERMLRATLAGFLLFLFLRNNVDRAPTAGTDLPSIGKPSRHPVGNWLAAVRDAHGCKDFYELAHKLPFDAPDGLNITQPRLKKWSSGQDLIPVSAGERLTVGLPEAGDLEIAFLAARTLALVVDFLCAAYIDNEGARQTSRPIQHQARKIVSERLQQLVVNLGLAAKENATRKQGLPA